MFYNMFSKHCWPIEYGFGSHLFFHFLFLSSVSTFRMTIRTGNSMKFWMANQYRFNCHSPIANAHHRWTVYKCVLITMMEMHRATSVGRIQWVSHVSRPLCICNADKFNDNIMKTNAGKCIRKLGMKMKNQLLIAGTVWCDAICMCTIGYTMHKHTKTHSHTHTLTCNCSVWMNR